MCWRVWWSPGAIRWPVADPWCGSRTQHRPTSPKRPRLGFRRSPTTLYPSLCGPPHPLTWTCWSISFGHTSRTSRTWPPTTPKPAWSPPSAEYSPSSRWCLWKRHAPRSGIQFSIKVLNKAVVLFSFGWQFYRSTQYNPPTKWYEIGFDS